MARFSTIWAKRASLQLLGDLRQGLFALDVGRVRPRHRDEVVHPQLELGQVLVLAFGEGVEGLHLEILVVPGDVGFADPERPQVERGDAADLLDAGFHAVEVAHVELAGLAGETAGLGFEAFAAGIDRQFGGRFQFFNAHEEFSRGIGDDAFGFLVVLAHHRGDILRREHDTEAERAALGGHDGHAVDAVIVNFFEHGVERWIRAKGWHPWQAQGRHLNAPAPASVRSHDAARTATATLLRQATTGPRQRGNGRI